MPYLIIAIAIIVILAIGIGSVFYRKRYQDEVYVNNLKEARQFLEIINAFNDYVTWKERSKILGKYKSVHEFFEGKESYYRREKVVKEFNRIYENFKEYVDDYNETYVAKTIEENDLFFNHIEGKSLDWQQRKAIVTDEYSNLVVAGAGSGKTLTILGKVLFLTKIKKVPPGRILLMSYTRKTVNDLNERLEKIHSDVRASTFHKLGLDIITEHEGARPNVANEKLLVKIVRDYLKKGIADYPEKMQALVEFVACYSNIPEDYNDFDSAGERFDFYRGNVDYETLKSKVERAGGIKNTLAGETVKSVEELMIANFLYLNGIEYDYEKLYPYSDFTYHPDFYLKDYDIWLEHFGVDEDGKAKWLDPYESKKYAEKMKSKRLEHQRQGTTLLETYSYYNKQHRLLKELEKMLKAHGVKLQRVNTQEIYDSISQDKYFGYQLENLIISFINLCKSRALNEKEILDIYSAERADNFMTLRAKLFLTFALPILKEYKKSLKEENSIDFHDMINHSADIVNKKGSPMKYDYIIVDEYQDISFSRFKLINELRKYSDAKVLCVGDDWQSIYRFAGSDISLFSNFGNYVGEYKQLLIEKTYRNSKELVEISSNFIQKNPMQIKKHPISDKTVDNPISFVQYDANNDDKMLDVLLDSIGRLVQRYGTKSSIMILGRHSFDIYPFIYEDVRFKRCREGISMDEDGNITIDYLNYDNLKFSTVHRAKGLEADNIIVIHMENSQYGFPNKLTDDPILIPLLSEQEEYRYAEERRLCYVALTRTKKEVILMAPSINESEFYMELLQDNNYVIATSEAGEEFVNCPWCKTGKLVIRRNGKTGEQFLGCSHYPQCNQTYKDVNILRHPIKCQRCGSGFLVKRHGKYGDFLGCTNWEPDNKGCNNTVKLDN